MVKIKNITREYVKNKPVCKECKVLLIRLSDTKTEMITAPLSDTDEYVELVGSEAIVVYYCPKCNNVFRYTWFTKSS